jgi:signal peptidase II
MTMARARIVFIAASLLLVGCDHYTKHVAKVGLENQPPHIVAASVLDLRYTENTDSGFGLLRWVPSSVRKPLLTTVQLVSGIALLGLALGRKRRQLAKLALLLVSAGALGNGLDRLCRGYVVDFIHLHHWPVFNVADVYITAGAILMALAARRASPSGPPTAASP